MSIKVNVLYVLSLSTFLFSVIVNSVPWAIWGLALMLASLFESWQDLQEKKK